ncbi:DNA primase [Yersinia pestis D106004]|nr:DNA primase [Yersinia pestis D106004]
MNYDRLEFVESIEELATMHGLEVPYEAGSGTTQIERHQRQSLYQLMESLSAFYQQSLKGQNAKQAREYLKHRGLSRRNHPTFCYRFCAPWLGQCLKTFWS